MTRPDPRAAALALAVLAAPPAAAQDPARAVELRAHAALAEVRARPGASLAPFETDGCSGGMSTVWRTFARLAPAFAAAHGDRPPWEDCCVEHDRAYHLGGEDPAPAASFAARAEADAALGLCVRARAEAAEPRLSAAYGLTPAQTAALHAALAEAMVAAVRIGGGPCTGLPWRWGYGWPGCGPFAD